MNIATCKTCLISFNKTKNKKAFCSRSCAIKTNNTLRKKKNKAVCICCGTCFYFKKGGSIGKYCSTQCHATDRVKINLNKNITLLQAGKLTQRPAIKKTLIHLGMKNCCAICGLSSWMEKPLPLSLDHIDGNPANNTISNFRLLCSNCDSQTEFFKAKNKGRGRTILGLRK